MAYKLWDYQDHRGINRIEQWSRRIPKGQLGKLNNRLQLLGDAKNDREAVDLLDGTTVASILKIKINGNPQLRPMLCRGPINMMLEFTLLQGSIEKQFVNVPHESEAAKLRAQVQTNENYRCPHVRVSVEVKK